MIDATVSMIRENASVAMNQPSPVTGRATNGRTATRSSIRLSATTTPTIASSVTICGRCQRSRQKYDTRTPAIIRSPWATLKMAVELNTTV